MKNLLYLFIFLVTFSTFAQGEANVWYFGHNAGLDFNTIPPTALAGADQGQIDTYEGCSSFSDASGNLLFYSDGTTVWNRNHQPMPNGVGLAGDPSSSQSAMIIPKPGSTTIYYIFTVGAQSSGTNLGFNYYELDMSADGGLGNIVSTRVDLTKEKNAATWTEKVAAVKGDECETFWVISATENVFFAYKVTATGVATTPVRSTVPYFSSDPRGYLKISPDGTKIGIAHFQLGGFLIYDFDDVTGVVSNEQRLALPSIGSISNTLQPDTPYGVEFSPNSKKVYVHASNNGPFDNNSVGAHYSSIIQYDITLPTTADINNSREVVDARNLYRGALQLGPDHKIYRSLSQSYLIGIPFLGVIESPNEVGTAANYQDRSISLSGQDSSQGLPPFIASIFSQIELMGDDGNGNSVIVNDQFFDLCTGDNISITSEALVGTPIYNWYKDLDPIPFSNNPNLSFPSATPADNGVYKLQAEFTDACGIISTLEGEFTLTVYNVPTAGIGSSNIIECDDDNNGTFPFDLSVNDAIIINGQAGMEVLYFDDVALTNQITTPNAFESASKTIYAKIQSVGNNNCYDTITFDIELYDSAFPLDAASISPIENCDNTSVGTDTDGFILFDLTQNESTILNGQSATEFTLTYFTDAAYSVPISTPSNSFENTISDGQTIYIRMTNNLENSCYADTSFEIKVFELPTILDTYLFKNCDEDGDPNAETDFNLDEANEFITLRDNALTVTYYSTFPNAAAGTSPISSAYNNRNGNTVYARIETADGCHRVSTLTLQVSTTSFPVGYSKTLSTCDDDNTIDGLHTFDLSDASTDLIAQFPAGQNLSVHYYKTLTDAQLEVNELLPQNDYMSETPFNQTIYVRVESDDNGDCFGLGGNLTLVVNPRPEFEVDPEAIVCLNLPPITLKTYNPSGVYTYEWTDESGTVISSMPTVQVSSGGIYTVIATSTDGNFCESFPHEVVVSESIIASIDYDDVTITDDSDNNTITINNDNNNLGIGDYEFALGDGNGGIGFYQDEPFFDNVAPGIVTIYVQDKNNCGVATLEVAVIGFPKFLTPNNDGYNDTWQIKGVSGGFFTNSTIYVFDRFGKIIANIDATGNGWDGIYNGEALPSDDYWFTAELVDRDGNIRYRKGHFSLIRR